MSKPNKRRWLRRETGRVAGSGMNEDKYDEEYNPTEHKTVRGVDGVILPNKLNKEEYDKYVNSKAGPVIIKKPITKMIQEMATKQIYVDEMIDEIKEICKSMIFQPMTARSSHRLKDLLDNKLKEFYLKNFIKDDLVSEIILFKPNDVHIMAYAKKGESHEK